MDKIARRRQRVDRRREPRFRVKELAEQARDMAEETLMGAKRIELRNPGRGKYFRIGADVYADGESLADKLKRAGLAKDYDGEGAKPEW